MRNIAVIDSETDPFKRGRIPKPFIFGFFNGEDYTEYTNLDYLIEDLQDQELIVYAHNGGKFDYHFMLKYLQPYDEDIFIINGRLARFKIGICEFRDSINILPVALAQYNKEEFDYTLLEASKRNIPGNQEKISAYLKSDCVNLYNMVTAFVERYGLHITQASCAMKTWVKMEKQRLSDKTFKPPRSTEDYYNQLGKYYFGGRVQCFEQGIIERDFAVIDINSAYPYAMTYNHPISIEYFHNEGKPKTIKGHMFLTVKAKSKGAFPFRENKQQPLTFPADDIERVYYVTGWEVLAAKQTNTAEITEYIEYYEHVELTDFTEYIYYFYDLRRQAKAEGNKEDDLFSKLLMNSLYGKFGSNPDKYNKYIILPQDELNSLVNGQHGYNFGGELGPWILGQRSLDDGEKRFYNVATSASITGFVRAYLWKAINACEGVLYCDTDSIAAETIHEKSDLLEIGNDLGKWKHEGDFDKAGIGGKKLYIFRGKKIPGKKRDYKTASKGAKLSYNQLWKIAKGGDVTYKPINPTFSLKKSPGFVDRKITQTF
jgi:hypothetical protein